MSDSLKKDMSELCKAKNAFDRQWQFNRIDVKLLRELLTKIENVTETYINTSDTQL